MLTAIRIEQVKSISTVMSVYWIVALVIFFDDSSSYAQDICVESEFSSQTNQIPSPFGSDSFEYRRGLSAPLASRDETLSWKEFRST